MKWPWARESTRILGVSLAIIVTVVASLALVVAWSGTRRTPPASAALASASATQSATPDFTSTPSPSATAPSETPTPSPTASPTASATPTASPVPTNTPTATATATTLPTPTATVTPTPAPDGIARRLRVPILMYHYISAPPPGADAVRKDLSVPPDKFAQHLSWLREQGYVAISLYDLALALQYGAPLPEKPIILTFDDGYRDFYTDAFPLLQAHDYTATVFVSTAFVDEGRREFLSWEQIMELDAAGIDIQPHGYNHAELRNQSIDYLIWQILGPKQAIEARTTKPVRFFCYPSGKYDERTVAVLKSAGYWGAVTVTAGVEQDSEHMFAMPRIRVRGGYTAQDLAQVIAWHMGGG
jgi:peptidoglycan/xylan/chitin deacetylase (PgdA/CDA1 family)